MLEQLKRGELAGATTIKIAEGLTEFPEALFELADSLEYLDLSHNRLSSLPAQFSRFHKLKILFLSFNQFTHWPEVLAQCPALSMVGFKSNQIHTLPEHSLPANIRWLILTDNRLQALPQAIGDYSQLQKVMLAGNRLRALPDSMQQCRHIELLRLSANCLSVLPNWLLNLPKLSWLAFSGNACAQVDILPALPEADWRRLEISHQLGEGASGNIFQAYCPQRGELAVKVFKGEVTSDGLPQDEMQATVAAGCHPHLVPVLSELAAHPEQKKGLLLELIDASFGNLAGPPSLQSCTRDIYPSDTRFSVEQVRRIALAVADVAAHLHQRKILHGDLYAHNMLVNANGDCRLTDFGAASRYSGMTDLQAALLQRLEVRAFGCLLQELLTYCVQPVPPLQQLVKQCLQSQVVHRPDFAYLKTCLTAR